MVYDVTSLMTNKTDCVHAARLMLYRDQLDGSIVSKKLMEHVEHTEANYEIIEKLLDIREASDGIFVQVQWAGLPEKCDWTWNSIEQLHEDVPEKLEYLLSVTRKKNLAKKAKKALGMDA